MSDTEYTQTFSRALHSAAHAIDDHRGRGRSKLVGTEGHNTDPYSADTLLFAGVKSRYLCFHISEAEAPKYKCNVPTKQKVEQPMMVVVGLFFMP